MAMFNGDANKVYALFFPPPPVDDPRPAPVLDLKPMFAKLPRDGGRITYIFTEHPTERGGAALFNVKHPDRMAGTHRSAFRRDASLSDAQTEIGRAYGRERVCQDG